MDENKNNSQQTTQSSSPPRLDNHHSVNQQFHPEADAQQMTPAATPPPQSSNPQPQPTTVPTNQSSTTNQAPLKRNKGRIMAIVGAALLSVALLGFGGLWAYQTFFISDIDRVFSAIANTSDDEEVDLNFDIRASSNEAGLAEIIDGSDSIETGLDVRLREANYQVDLSLNFGEVNIDGSVAGDYAFDELYAKLDTSAFTGDSPLSAFTALVPAALLEKYDDTWISFDVSEFVQDDFDELSDEEIQEIKDMLIIVKNSGFVAVTADESRTLEGVEATGYGITFNSDFTQPMVYELRAQNFTLLEDITDKQFENVVDDLEEFATSYNQGSELIVYVDGTQLRGVEITDSDDSYELNITGVYNVDDLEQVELPAESVPFSEFWNDVNSSDFSTLLGGLAAPSLEQSRIDTNSRSNVARIGAAIELYAANNGGKFPVDIADIEGLVDEDVMTDVNGVKIGEPGSQLRYELICSDSGSCRNYKVSVVLSDGEVYEYSTL